MKAPLPSLMAELSSIILYLHQLGTLFILRTSCKSENKQQKNPNKTKQNPPKKKKQTKRNYLENSTNYNQYNLLLNNILLFGGCGGGSVGKNIGSARMRT